MSDTKSPSLHARARWQRWEMASFESMRAESQAQREPAEQAPAELPADVVTQLEQLGLSIRAKAEQEGHAAGYAAGHAQGLDAGAAQGREQGWREGHEAGYREGLEAGREQARQETARLQALADHCAHALDNLENDIGQALISLALNIARQVLRTELTQRPDLVLDTVRDILHMDSEKDGTLRLYMNPADIALAQDYLAREPLGGAWRLVEDDTIERGGCIAQTALGDIDATLQTRWQRIAASLGKQGSEDTRP